MNYPSTRSGVYVRAPVFSQEVVRRQAANIYGRLHLAGLVLRAQGLILPTRCLQLSDPLAGGETEAQRCDVTCPK